MKKLSLKTIEIIGVFFIFFLGSLDHFLYDWSHITAIGLFSPVNESPWEHLKIFFFPMLLFMVVEWFWVKDKKTLLLAKAMESMAAMLFIIVFFYTYTGAFGIENVWIDIASFFLAICLGQMISYNIITAKIKWKGYKWLHVAVLAGFTLLFWLATFFPPHIPLFFSEPNSSYGIQK